MPCRKKMENKDKFVFDETDVVSAPIPSNQNSVQYRLAVARGQDPGISKRSQELHQGTNTSR